MLKIKTLTISLLSLILLFALAACGGNASKGSSSNGQSASKNTNQSDSKGSGTSAKKQSSNTNQAVTIRFSTWDSGHEQLIKKFEKKYPNIKVDYEKVAGDYNTKLLTQIAAGDAPDVFEVGNPVMYAENGAIDNLLPYMERDHINQDSYYKSVLNMGLYQNKLYAMPKDYSDMVIFYNKKMFDDAGLPYPKDGWTWDDFIKDAKKLTEKKNGKTVRWGASVGSDWDMPFEAIVQQAGGHVSSQDGKKVVGYMNSDAAVNAMNYFLTFFEDGLAPNPTDRKSLKGVDLFASQKVAMDMTGKWFLQNWKKTPGLKFGAVGLPKDTQRANLIAWAGFSLNAKSKHKDAAWKLLKFIGGYEGSMQYGKYALPAMPKAAKDLGIAKDPVISVFLSELKYVHQLPFQRYAYWNQTGGKVLTDTLDKLIAKASKGTVTKAEIKKALDQAASQTKKLMKEKSSK